LSIVTRVTAQIERQAEKTELGYSARAIEVLALIAAPAVDKQHGRTSAYAGDQPTLDLLIINGNLDRLIVNCHTL
jgi:hypothetical protein